MLHLHHPTEPGPGGRLNPAQRHYSPGLDPSQTGSNPGKAWTPPFEHNPQCHKESLPACPGLCFCRVHGLQSRRAPCPASGRLHLQLTEPGAWPPSLAQPPLPQGPGQLPQGPGWALPGPPPGDKMLPSLRLLPTGPIPTHGSLFTAVEGTEILPP